MTISVVPLTIRETYSAETVSIAWEILKASCGFTTVMFTRRISVLFTVLTDTMEPSWLR